jgi:outer membrane protein OmpA-like peptidoglycan-associated protein
MPPAAPPAAPSVNLTVQFANGSAELTPAAVRTLSELGRALSSRTLSAFRFRIEGHTDTVGTPEANKALSDRRAKAVADFLATRFAIDTARLEPVGMGEDGLLVETPPNTPEPRNRRVQVVNLGA